MEYAINKTLDKHRKVILLRVLISCDLCGKKDLNGSDTVSLKILVDQYLFIARSENQNHWVFGKLCHVYLLLLHFFKYPIHVVIHLVVVQKI